MNDRALNPLKNLIVWDFRIIVRYGIVPVAVGITVLYVLVFIFSDTSSWQKVIPVLIFSDPVMYGFLFTSIIILYEKDAQTQQALSITPLSSRQYVISKIIVFGLLALICSMAMLIAAGPEIIHWMIFTLAVVLSASLFVLIGIVCVSFAQNFNQFILSVPIVLSPSILPFLAYFDLYQSWFYYFIPTHASLLLFDMSINKINWGTLIYAISYLLMCNAFAFAWAIKTYNQRILKTNTK